MNTETANLIDGTQVTICERLHLTRSTGETVLYAARTVEGRIVAAKTIASIY